MWYLDYENSSIHVAANRGPVMLGLMPGALPTGFAFIVDDNGAYLTDDDGAYLIDEVA